MFESYPKDLKIEDYRVLIAKVLGNKLLEYSKYIQNPIQIKEPLPSSRYFVYSRCSDINDLCDYIYRKLGFLEIRNREMMWQNLQILWWSEGGFIRENIASVVELMGINCLGDLDLTF